jgi:hypothetical protein
MVKKSEISTRPVERIKARATIASIVVYGGDVLTRRFENQCLVTGQIILRKRNPTVYTLNEQRTAHRHSKFLRRNNHAKANERARTAGGTMGITTLGGMQAQRVLLKAQPPSPTGRHSKSPRTPMSNSKFNLGESGISWVLSSKSRRQVLQHELSMAAMPEKEFEEKVRMEVVNVQISLFAWSLCTEGNASH